jgi:hypothetical protein
MLTTFKTIIFMMVLGAFSGVTAQAQEIYPFYRDIRAQGMGGAGVATVNDPAALFINPAGLGRIRGPYFSLVNAELETNYDTQSALSVNSNYGAITNTQNLLGVAVANPDKHLHFLLQTLPAFVTTNFGFGVLGKYDFDAQYNATTGLMHLDYFNDYAAVMGYCFRLFSGVLKIGVAGKVVNRVYVSQDISNTATNVTLQSLPAAEGTGAGWDASAMVTIPWAYLPTFTVVAHDIGNTKFTLGSGYFVKSGVTPPPQMQSVDAGIGFFPIVGRGTRMSITAEYRDIQNPQAVDFFRAFHAGAELNVADTLFLRAGMNEHYYTAGLEWDFIHNQIQIATYGEDIGTPANPQEDRRFTFDYSFRF